MAGNDLNPLRAREHWIVRDLPGTPGGLFLLHSQAQEAELCPVRVCWPMAIPPPLQGELESMATATMNHGPSDSRWHSKRGKKFVKDPGKDCLRSLTLGLRMGDETLQSKPLPGKMLPLQHK